MSSKPVRLCIVGAGLTASVTSALIKQHFPRESVEIHVWEKSRGIGGRMNTHRASDGQSTVDLGAQYITRMSQYAEKHKKFFDDLIEAEILKPFPGKIEGENVDEEYKNFMAPNGINNVVKHFFNCSDAKVNLNRFCQEINLCHKGGASSDMWTATAKDGTSEQFDGVILTIPVPQILQLGGTFHDCLKNYRSSLEQVQYSSRYAFALFYPKDTKVDVPWTAKYVNNHPCIRFVSVDSVKRDSSDASCLSILVHTSVPFGLAHLDSDIQEIEDTIFGYFQELFPELPQPLSTRCIRWRFSQVYKPYPGQPGTIVVSKEPLLMLAGDSFVHQSHFSGCVESGEAVFEKLQEYLRI